MAASSGTRYLARQVSSWSFAFACVGVGIVYLDDLKTMAREVMGLPAVETTAREEAAAVRTEPTGRPARAGTVELRAGANGHFHTSADVNGRAIDVMVDTGASIVALTFEDAERAGIFVRESDFTHRVSTANGIARVAPVTLDRVAIGEIMVRNVRAAVAERGKLAQTLLGMSFLGKLSKAEMSRGVLVLAE